MIAYDRDGIVLHQGNVLSVLAGMAENSVHCVVTSPPYFGPNSLRVNRITFLLKELTDRGR